MARAQREWAKRRRLELIRLLGNACAHCGLSAALADDTRRLHIHHVDGRNWDIHAHDQSARVSQYWREYLAGVRLMVVCDECHPPGSGECISGLKFNEPGFAVIERRTPGDPF